MKEVCAKKITASSAYMSGSSNLNATIYNYSVRYLLLLSESKSNLAYQYNTRSLLHFIQNPKQHITSTTLPILLLSILLCNSNNVVLSSSFLFCSLNDGIMLLSLLLVILATSNKTFDRCTNSRYFIPKKKD